MDFVFEWDEEKAKSNTQKHGVTFRDAITIFTDPFLLTFHDESHSDSEDQFISIGTSEYNRVLLFVHTYRNGVIRIISSRIATRQERKPYERG